MKSKSSHSFENKEEGDEDKENQPPAAADPTGQTEIMEETPQEKAAVEGDEIKQNDPAPKTSSNTEGSEEEDSQAATAANTEIEPLKSDQAKAEERNKDEAGEESAKVRADTSFAEVVKE